MIATLVLLSIAIGAGFLGALLGLGGGVIIIPTLTLLFGIDIKYAIAASLISIIATSSGAAASYLKDHLTNLRLAVFLEVGTVAGAFSGFFIASRVNSSELYLFFGGFLLFSAAMMLRKKGDSFSSVNHPWSDKLHLEGTIVNKEGKRVEYKVANTPWGLAIMFLAGNLSAVLGIGSGIFKVLAMDNVMKIPMKVSSATSNFMIGVTAAASAGAYLLRGDIRFEIATPVSLGIIVGSWIGARVMPKVHTDHLRKIFVVVLSITAIQMIMKGFR